MRLTEIEFEERVSPHRRELAAHCYRMLGSIVDAEDALQETLIRAWKALPEFEGRSSLRTWLYRIASRVCLDAAERRKERVLPNRYVEASEPKFPTDAPDPEAPWLEPAPASYWKDLPANPEASIDAKQSVGLAFLTVIQQLPATQRAVLLLRDVMGWSAAEVSDLLDTSVAAVNSALQRARSSLEAKRVQRTTAASEEDGARSLLARYIQAWEKGSPDQLAALLREDATLTMPPIPNWFSGAANVVAFFRMLAARVGPMRARMTEACGTVAGALYMRSPDSPLWVANSIHVLEADAGQIVMAHAFMMPPEHFERFGLPPTLPQDR